MKPYRSPYENAFANYNIPQRQFISPRVYVPQRQYHKPPMYRQQQNQQQGEPIMQGFTDMTKVVVGGAVVVGTLGLLGSMFKH